MPLPRVLFVNRFYWPEQPATAQLLADLAGSLAAAGVAVTIITSHPGDDAIPSAETHRGVAVVRIGAGRLGQSNLVKRSADFARFLIDARRAVARHAHPGDTVVAMTDPPLLGVALAGIAKRKDLRIIHWIQDVFPEVAAAVGHKFATIARPVRDRAWRSADACVVLGRDMAALLRERGVPANRIHLCPNWAPEGLQPSPPETAAALRARWGLGGKFIVAYAGNLGRVHDFSAILPLAESLRSAPDFAFVFIGGGAQRPALEAAARRRGLTNIHFQPAQPRERLAETLALGDIHLITLRPGCERLVFPSKLYGIAAIGRPVLFVGPRDCEVARVIESNRFGHAFIREEIIHIGTTLRALKSDPGALRALGDAAAAFYEREGRLHHATARWLALLAGKPLAENSPPSSS